MFTKTNVPLLTGLNASLDGLATTAEGLSIAQDADFSLPGEVSSREAAVQLTDSVISKGGAGLLVGLESLASIVPSGCASHSRLPLLYKPGGLYVRKDNSVYEAGPFWSVVDTPGHAVGGSQAQRSEAVNVTETITGYTSQSPRAWYANHGGVYPSDVGGSLPSVVASCAARSAVFYTSGADVKMKFGFPTTSTVTLASNFFGASRSLWAIDCGTYTLLAYTNNASTISLMRVSDTGTIITSTTVSRGPLSSGDLSIGLGYNNLTGVAVLIASSFSSAQLLLQSVTASTLSTLATATPTVTYGSGVRDCAVGCCSLLPDGDRWKALVHGDNGYIEVYSFPESDIADFNATQELSPVDMGSGKYDAWSILCQPTAISDRLVFGAINHQANVSGPAFTPIQLGTWVILDTKNLAIVAAGDEGTCAVTTQGSSASIGTSSLIFGVAKGAVFNNGTVTHTRAVSMRLDCTGATTAVANGVTYLSGKVGYCFDGDACFPAGFPIRPAVRCVAGTGGSLSAGDYSIQLVWKFIDGLGNIHESAPSDKTTITVASSGSITINSTIPVGTYGSVWADVYIAGPNPSQNSGLYRVSSSAASLSPIVITSIPGGVLSALPPLYTNGGILENNALTASRGVISAGKRLWSSDGRRILASKLVSYSQGVSWSYLADDSLIITPPPSAGAVKGIGAIDDVVFVFCENSVLLVGGTGPADVGGTSDFDTPREVYRAPGPSLPIGVCGTPTGVVWSAAGGGIHVINAAGQGTSIGQAIGGEWGRICYLPAVLDQTSNRLKSARLFALSHDGSKIAVFCLDTGAWSVYYSEYTTTDVSVADGICYFTQQDADSCWAYYSPVTKFGQFTLATLLRDLVFDSRVHSISPMGLLRSGVGTIEVFLYVDEARYLAASKQFTLNLNTNRPPRTGLFNWVPSMPHLTSYMLKLVIEGDVTLSGITVETQSSGTLVRSNR